MLVNQHKNVFKHKKSFNHSSWNLKGFRNIKRSFFSFPHTPKICFNFLQMFELLWICYVLKKSSGYKWMPPKTPKKYRCSRDKLTSHHMKNPGRGTYYAVIILYRHRNTISDYTFKPKTIIIMRCICKLVTFPVIWTCVRKSLDYIGFEMLILGTGRV